MSNITVAINDQIRRLARREVTAGNRKIKKATAQYRRAIAAANASTVKPGWSDRCRCFKSRLPRKAAAPTLRKPCQNARLRTDESQNPTATRWDFPPRTTESSWVSRH